MALLNECSALKCRTYICVYIKSTPNQNYSKKHHLESIQSKDHSWQGQLSFSDVFYVKLRNGLVSLKEKKSFYHNKRKKGFCKIEVRWYIFTLMLVFLRSNKFQVCFTSQNVEQETINSELEKENCSNRC